MVAPRSPGRGAPAPLGGRTTVYRGIRHSMHLSSRFAQALQTYVCPQGRTTGKRSSGWNSSKQIMQWKEKELSCAMVDVAAAAADRSTEKVASCVDS
jgi:hypothetical protein